MKDYIIQNSYKASKGIASAVLVCLGSGLLLQTIGTLTDIGFLIQLGAISKTLFIPALGISIALMLGASPMVVICAAISSVIGGGGYASFDSGSIGISGGEPIGAIIAALVSIWVGNRVSGKTGFDMILTPILCLLSGGAVGMLSSKIIAPLLTILSSVISSMVETSPVISSFLIAITFAFLILSPASSAALAIALQLDPTASAAALIGCSVQFTAFAFLGIRVNPIGAFFAQLIYTPKLQTPNIIKSPRIMLIPILLSGLMSPIGVLLFDIKSTSEVAGLGFCAFVAPLYMLSTEGVEMFLYYILVALIVPAIICLILQSFIFKLGWIKASDLQIHTD